MIGACYIECPALRSVTVLMNTLSNCENVYINYCSPFLFQLDPTALQNVRILQYYCPANLNINPIVDRMKPAFEKSNSSPL